MPHHRIPAVILAAGFSRRLGRAKQTLRVGDETLVLRAARAAAEAGFSPVLMVVREDADFRESLEHSGFQCVLNPDAVEGIASSIRAGVSAAAAFTNVGAILLTCDQPALTPQHLAALAADPTRTTASAYAGHRGIPAYFAAADFPSLLALRGDTGARKLLVNAHAILNESLAFDIDTEADALLLEIDADQHMH